MTSFAPADLGFPADLEDLRARDLAPVEVAVLDSGVDGSHPLLAGRLVAAFDLVPAEDGPAAVAVPVERNNDTFGHGTAVASIVAGIAPNARIVDLRVLGPGNEGAGDALVAALRLVVERRSPVANMSLAASPRFASVLQGLCDAAYRQGQVVVAATRNMPLLDYGFPAELSVSVSVDSVETERLFRVRYRPEQVVEFGAHGEELRVAAAGGGWTTKTGTSFATPVVAGIVALLLGHDPTLRPFEVKTLLKAYARGG